MEVVMKQIKQYKHIILVVIIVALLVLGGAIINSRKNAPKTSGQDTKKTIVEQLDIDEEAYTA